MSIAANVEKTIKRIPPGRLFGYEVFKDYQTAPGAVVKAVNRRVAKEQLRRFERGRFYTPEQSKLFGEMSVSDSELLRDSLLRLGQRIGYITGPALYNRMGLTTQVPKTVDVAANRTKQLKDLHTIRILYIPQRAPITKATIPLLELLDVLRDADHVPDAQFGFVVNAIIPRFEALIPAQIKRIQKLALGFYKPATRALLGTMLDRIEQPVLSALRASISPTTRVKLRLDLDAWPQGRAWNIEWPPPYAWEI